MSKMGNYVVEQEELYASMVSGWAADTDIIEAFKESFKMSHETARRSVADLAGDDWDDPLWKTRKKAPDKGRL